MPHAESSGGGGIFRRGESGRLVTTVGFVIRTLNEEELIGRCLETLARQAGGLELDVLVVDSGSTDSTLAIAEAHDVRVVKLLPGEFDYSKALNVGIEQVAGDVVLSLSAHAIPVDDTWLEHMVAPFEDPLVAGVASRQVPWPDAPWQEVHRLGHQFGESGRTYGAEDAGDEIVFSNAASAIRRSVWEQEPFTLPAAEDFEWAQRVVAAGWKVVYESEAAVYHSHDESPRAQALRMIDLHRVQDAGAGVARTRRRTVREAAGFLVRDGRKIARLDEPLHRKVAYFADLVRMVCYYVLDFSKWGTTAQRRQSPPSKSETV